MLLILMLQHRDIPKLCVTNYVTFFSLMNRLLINPTILAQFKGEVNPYEDWKKIWMK